MKLILILAASLMTFAAQADTATGDSYSIAAKTGRWDKTNNLIEIVGMTVPYSVNGVTKNVKAALDVSELDGGMPIAEMMTGLLSDIRGNKMMLGIVYDAETGIDDTDTNCLGVDYQVVSAGETYCIKVKAKNIYLK